MCLYIHFTQVDVDGKKVSLFDSLEDTNSSDCLKTAQKIAGVTEAKSSSFNTNTAFVFINLTLQALLRCCGDFFVLLLFNFFLVVLGKRKGKRGERETWRGRIDCCSFLLSFSPGPCPLFFSPPPLSPLPPLSKPTNKKKKGAGRTEGLSLCSNLWRKKKE